jgi:hypothetical protein
VLAAGRASASFVIAEGCGTVPVTLGVYLTRGLGFSLPQTLLAYTGGVFGPGSHSLSIAVPQCFFQVDLMGFQVDLMGVATPPAALRTSADLAAQKPLVWAFGGTTTQCTSETPGGGTSGEKPPTGGDTNGTGGTNTGGTPSTPAPQPVTQAPAPVAETAPAAVAPVVETAPAAVAPVVAPQAPFTPPAPATPVAPSATKAPAATGASPKATGGVAGVTTTKKGAPLATAIHSGTLPFTGLPIWLVTVLGVGLIALGTATRRATRTNA